MLLDLDLDLPAAIVLVMVLGAMLIVGVFFIYFICWCIFEDSDPW